MGNEAKKMQQELGHRAGQNSTLGTGGRPRGIKGRLIVHTRIYNATMGNEARKTHCSHKELQCKQWVMKQGRLIVHTRSYNANNG
ncbi:hypothetical protein KSS87_007036 [Heliosperma pusillum]|nr:hypothetical protein KSS87_007036 [Heliosperma pusillum]